jgi:hypothetical protein
MPLPGFNEKGDLGEGVHPATMDEVVARFGSGTVQREAVTRRLLRIYELAKSSGKLDRLLIFGSYITTKPEPNDVDLILVMSDDFRLGACPQPAKQLFDHEQAAEAFGASIFWIRPSMLFLETLEEFLGHWQLKADGTRRGIVEVRG